MPTNIPARRDDGRCNALALLRNSVLLVLSLTATTYASQSTHSALSGTASEPIERGQAIVGQAFALLSSNLAKAIRHGGVTNALSYCSIHALPLTKVVSDTNHVWLSRVTHKARNPANKADFAEAGILTGFERALEEGKTPTPLLVTNASNSVLFYSPIILNNRLCLKCHGEPGVDIDSSDLAYLRQLYPDDRAIGFKFGDLRGMWRIEFKATPTK